MTYEAKRAEYAGRCEEALGRVAHTCLRADSVVSQAARYSLMNGGKRVRGVLVLAVCDMLAGDVPAAGDYAAAIEMVHAYSLIHDDLPCMDDDDMRRGKPANHIVYGEANALLAGDLLLTAAFEAIARADAGAEGRIAAVQTLAQAAGAHGMVYGQELDLAHEHGQCDEATLRQIHLHKTGALIKGAAHLGVIAAGHSIDNCAEITTYAENVGLAFQIVDDILDKTSTQAELGKPVGSDAAHEKVTFVSLCGMAESTREVHRLTREAIAEIERKYADKSKFLSALAQQLSQRVN